MDQADAILSKILTERGDLSPEMLDPLVIKAAQTSGGLASLLIQRGLVSEDAVLNVWSEHFRLPRVNLARTSVDKSAIDKVPLKVAEYYRFLPLKLENRKMTVAISRPYDLRTQDEIRTHLGCEVSLVLAQEREISEAIKKWYGLGAGTMEKILETASEGGSAVLGPVHEQEKVEEIEKMAEGASVIKLVNQILMDAQHKRASDIHIEPYRGAVKIRYRIDGVLYRTNVPPEITKFIHAIVSRIKVLSSLNIIERRLPQDGRAIVKVGGETLDLRISCIPTSFGESIVIRLLPIVQIHSLELLGLTEDEMKIFRRLIELPHGIILITGPTGSGKSTTLYGCLSSINGEDRKIITIEDPVEHEMEGITQIQVVPSIELDFARGLRSILRHDPDVIMVGEIRDLETAEIASRVALTGHLVFSTLHTNDSASGITRLVDIGVAPYLVASSVEAFVAQRLVRTICPHCKGEDPAAPEELKEQIAHELGLKSAKGVTIYKGKGCEKCNESGYWGRVAIFEILVMDETIREMVMKHVVAGEIKKLAIARGMQTLRQSGWRKVLAGLTTPEEILEVSPDEISMASQTPAGLNIPLPEVSPPAPNETELSAPIERRAYVRLNTEVNVRYHAVRSEADLSEQGIRAERYTLSRNLSAGGLLFTSHEALPIGSIIELKIELPNDSEPIECLARVVRVTEIEENSTYDAAVCFLDLNGIDRARLDQFVQKKLKE